MTTHVAVLDDGLAISRIGKTAQPISLCNCAETDLIVIFRGKPKTLKHCLPTTCFTSSAG